MTMRKGEPDTWVMFVLAGTCFLAILAVPVAYTNHWARAVNVLMIVWPVLMLALIAWAATEGIRLNRRYPNPPADPPKARP